MPHNLKPKSRDSSVGIATGQPRKLGSIPGMDKRLFSSVHCLNGLWGPPSLLSSGHEADHPHPSSADVKNT
jgi:hypothetical protein